LPGREGASAARPQNTRGALITISYDGGPKNFGVSILEFREDKIARESIYVAEGWEAPEWRSRWSSTP
jgi:hypothetical protein